MADAFASPYGKEKKVKPVDFCWWCMRYQEVAKGSNRCPECGKLL